MKQELLTLCILILLNALTPTFGVDDWLGRWFPHDPSQENDDNPTVEIKTHSNEHGSLLTDDKHRVLMGLPNKDCDDGRTNLTMDWDESPVDYFCYEDEHEYLPKSYIHPNLHLDHIPKRYSAPHACMNESISYSDNVPTFGTHRPLWPKYGEYLYVPKQRWIHNLEHGAIVMLYHPCANRNEVDLLKSLVRACLYRHIITPYCELSPERSLALVGWGSRLEISKVDPNMVIEFIVKFALKGPEKTSREGQFDSHFLHPAKVVSDKNDTNLCPKLTK